VTRRIYKGNCCNKTVLLFLAVPHILSTMSQSVYCKYYQAQYGGELPVFRGGGSQSGAGIGDLLRGLGRMILPVALRGVSSLASNTLAGTQAGLSLGSAAKAAILHHFLQLFLVGRRGHLLSLEVVCYLMARTVYPQPRRPSEGIKGRSIQ